MRTEGNRKCKNWAKSSQFSAKCCYSWLGSFMQNHFSQLMWILDSKIKVIRQFCFKKWQENNFLSKITPIFGIFSLDNQNRWNRKTEWLRTGLESFHFVRIDRNRNRMFPQIKNRNRRILESNQHYYLQFFHWLRLLWYGGFLLVFNLCLPEFVHHIYSLVALNCGSTSTENNTYFESRGSESGSCRLKICPCNDNICQVRF